MLKLPFLRYAPNGLSLFRCVLIVPFLFYLYQKDYAHALFLFLLAGLTDMLDGWLARYFHCQTPFGSFIDPLADKLLITTSFLSLALIGELPWWLFALVLLRDLTISLGVLAWHFFICQPIELKPTPLSKLNTVLQLVLVILCLFEPVLFAFPAYVKELIILGTAATTAASYGDYVWTWGKKAYIWNV